MVPPGEYGAGRVETWDYGTYEYKESTDHEIKVVLNGFRVQGRYVLTCIGGDHWLIHRLDAPPSPDVADGEPMPALVRPMLATLGSATGR